MDNEYILTQAIVIDNNDTTRRGKIKIRILPELESTLEADLPWAIPYTSIQGEGVLSNDLPVVNSLVRLLVRKDWKRFYYLGNYFIESKFNAEEILLKISQIGSGSNYKDIIFRLYKDGGIQFHNSNTGEDGFISKSGSYSIFDSEGNIISHTGITNSITTEGGTVKLTGNASLTIGGTTINIQGSASGGVLTTQGVVTPSGSGPYCALPFCVMTGAPHAGSQVVLPPAS